MFTLTVFIPTNAEPICHRYSTFKRAIRKVREYQQRFDCTCFISCYDMKQSRYVVQRYKNGCKDTIEFAV